MYEYRVLLRLLAYCTYGGVHLSLAVCVGAPTRSVHVVRARLSDARGCCGRGGRLRGRCRWGHDRRRGSLRAIQSTLLLLLLTQPRQGGVGTGGGIEDGSRGRGALGALAACYS